MVSLFRKKKKPEEPPEDDFEMGVPRGKRVPSGPPNLENPEEYPEDEGIREEVGYLPPEEEPGAQFQQGEEPGQYESEESFPETEEPQGGEPFPPFLPPPRRGAEEFAGETFSREEAEQIAQDAAEAVRKEFSEKLKVLNEEISEFRKLDKEIEKMIDTFGKLERKYSELDDKISSLPTETQEDLKEIKATVNSINQIMSTALPALIKEVRDLKPAEKD